MANTKLVGSPLKKKCTNINQQQINNELTPNDFNKGPSITQKNKDKDTPRRAV